MDHTSSKPTPSFRAKIKQKLYLHRRLATSQHAKLNSHENFVGIALVTLINAEMKFKDKWLACISIGDRAGPEGELNSTNMPIWNSEKKFVLESNGPHIAKISVFETNRLSKNNLIEYCEIDLFEFLSRASDSDIEVFDLSDPSSSNVVVGKISISCCIEDYKGDGKLSFLKELFKAADVNGDGVVSMDELATLLVVQQENREPLINCCPVCGEIVEIYDK
ncbi:hypothetical protein L2E82_30174 [Cichorium intybus]|uniref:Uncharacterized protein n=1 Tax=Cichorium intybus TaxID=13427 RepID=A0ACB9CZH8_CICIN|nr:hypothetical protein L2E82_30174 [Cichorium intybus]